MIMCYRLIRNLDEKESLLAMLQVVDMLERNASFDSELKTKELEIVLSFLYRNYNQIKKDFIEEFKRNDKH